MTICDDCFLFHKCEWLRAPNDKFALFICMVTLKRLRKTHNRYVIYDYCPKSCKCKIPTVQHLSDFM